jgi:hypothetical protein
VCRKRPTPGCSGSFSLRCLNCAEGSHLDHSHQVVRREHHRSRVSVCRDIREILGVSAKPVVVFCIRSASMLSSFSRDRMVVQRRSSSVSEIALMTRSLLPMFPPIACWLR